VKQSKAAKVARQSRKTGTAGQGPTSEAMHMAKRTNRVVLCLRPCARAAAEGGSAQEVVADVEEEEAIGVARDAMMTENETATTAATERQAGALASNDWSDPAQLRKVIRVDYCGAGDGS